MLVMCNNYVNTIRFKGNGFLDYPNDFNFRLNSKIGIRNDKYAKKYKKVSK